MVARPTFGQASGPGHHAPARLLLIGAALAAAIAPATAQAQARGAQVAAPAQPVPDAPTLAKLVWSTMAAVDHANRTGNYSVLRELGSASFRAGNTAAALAAVFAGIRQQRLDLSAMLLLEPVYEFPPRMENGMLRMRGGFRTRPNGVQFDLIFQWDGAWKIDAIALNLAPMPR